MTVEELKSARFALVSGMKDYLADIDEDDEDESSCGPADAEKCGELLAVYLEYLFSGERTDNEILAQVKKTVLALNELNEKCDFELIETDEREQICEIIIEAARECGYQFTDGEEDITGEWRDW